MSAGTFKAAMIQMRSGLTPGTNSDDAVRMIGEAKSAGADYAQTPEMNNIMEVKRERLFATIVEEEADTSLATFRELARKLGCHPNSIPRFIKTRRDFPQPKLLFGKNTWDEGVVDKYIESLMADA